MDGNGLIIKIFQNKKKRNICKCLFNLLKEYLGKRVSLESMIILDSILGFSHTWNVKLEEDYAWKDVCKLMENYKSFLKFDETKFKFVLKQLML